MLVSIIVATYNCASYIEDTLDSVYRQTHQELELILTDDCSLDHSVEVAIRWIESHKDRFKRVVQTKTQHNSGVTANYNVGLKEARGEWIKCLDGDDMLPDDAIEKYVEYCKRCPAYKVLYAHEQTFNTIGRKGIVNFTTLPIQSVRKQMVYLLNHRLLGICTATNFIHRKTFVCQGGFDDRYPMYQDGSPFLQSLASGNPIGVVDDVLLLKRENPNSLMHTANPIMVNNIRDCHYRYAHYYLKYGLFFHFYNAWVSHFLGTHDTSNTSVKLLGYLFRCFDFINMYRKVCSSRS